MVRIVLPQKPPLGSVLSGRHPLSKWISNCFLFNEGSGAPQNYVPCSSQYVVNSGGIWAPEGISLNGTTDYIQLSLQDTYQYFWLNNFSIEIIVNPGGTIGQYDVIASHAVADGKGWRLWTRDSSNYKYLWEVNDGGAKNTASDTLQSTITPNGYHHIIGVHDGAYLKIYVNGKLEGTPTAAGAIVFSAPRVAYLGTMHGYTAARNANKTIRLFRTYDKALTDAEVADLYIDPYAMFERKPVWMNYYYEAAGGTLPIPNPFNRPFAGPLRGCL